MGFISGHAQLKWPLHLTAFLGRLCGLWSKHDACIYNNDNNNKNNNNHIPVLENFVTSYPMSPRHQSLNCRFGSIAVEPGAIWWITGSWRFCISMKVVSYIPSLETFCRFIDGLYGFHQWPCTIENTPKFKLPFWTRLCGLWIQHDACI